MNKFNNYGDTVIEYRSEFFNMSYPKLIHNSLKVAIDQKFDLNLASLIMNSDLTDEEFKKRLSLIPDCLKTEEEILEEMQEMLDQLMLEGDEYDYQCNVKDETIEVTKEYILDETFFKNYFDIEDEETYNKLIKKNGVFEKFAMLRLSKIFKDFLIDVDERTLEFKLDKSPVFYDADRNVYGIYLDFIIDIQYLENEDNIDSLRNQILVIVQDADLMFSQKTKA